MIFRMFDSPVNYLLTGAACVIAAYLTFYLCDLLYSLFYKMFDRSVKISVSPLYTLKSLNNIISAAMLLLFGCCWKGHEKRKGRAGVIVSSLLLTVCNLLLAELFYLLASLAAASESSLLVPVAILCKALFIVNVSVIVFSLCPLPPFPLGNIILSFLPERAAKGLEGLSPYSFFLPVVLAAVLGKGEVFDMLYNHAALLASSILDLFF